MTVAVYGLGRFGQLWAKLLSRQFHVIACSRSPSRIPPEGVELVEERELARAEAVFLCVAISAMPEVCGRLAEVLHGKTTVLDTCSVKVHPSRIMLGAFPEPTPLIATHPMFGPDSVGQGLGGLPLVICPLRAEGALVSRWREIFEGMGLAVQLMSPEEHDRRAAYTQGVTHFVGRVLAEMDLRPSSISTVGYRRLLEIIEQTCNDSWQLFEDLQRYNPYTAEMRSSLQRAIESVLARLEP